MCSETDLTHLVTMHHEMGHIQYFIQFKDKALQFRDAANPGKDMVKQLDAEMIANFLVDKFTGFHEAIGDTMALSVQTPVHLNSIGLLEKVTPSPQADINYLMKQAMERVMFLPFAYMIDQFRWALFNETISTEEMNTKWWELR